MRKFLALFVGIFSLLGFAAIIAVVSLRPDEEVPVSEPEIVYYPDNFSLTSYTPVIVGSDGEYVSASVSASIPSNGSSFLNYQWYVYTSVYPYWRPSSFTGNQSDTLSFQLNQSRSQYLFCCAVSSSLYDYVIVSPPISCRLVENDRKSDSDIILDYYEPWELEELDKDTLAAYEEKQKERET